MADFITRATTEEFDKYYEPYMALVPPGNLVAALSAQGERVLVASQAVGADREDFAYAPGKWTVRDLLRHISDTERVMGFRLASFARRDRTELPGFDQDVWAAGGASDCRSVAQIADEFVHLRRANVALVEGFDDASLDHRGRMWERDMSVRAVAQLLFGHAGHHLRVLEERYLS